MTKEHTHNGETFIIEVLSNSGRKMATFHSHITHDEEERLVNTHRINGIVDNKIIATEVAEDTSLARLVGVIKCQCESYINKKHPAESPVIKLLKELGFN